ncbi:MULTISPECIES: hypothetical protein [unclassified Adlercreutzia]|uniref:hypothetical protein n=1 Tax=unclassified Adlercreutzia TaxID=2636013 RepID=UPI0013EC68C0|nr:MULTISPECIES: hypothetical protein [unclassified Adlercreutzia]
MASRTFSSRVEESKLRFADSVARREHGVSFGQYCGTLVVDYICETGELPPTPRAVKPRRGIETMKELTAKHGESEVSRMSDAQIKELLAARYE